MRTWKKPSWVKDQEDWRFDAKNEVPQGADIFVKNYGGSERVKISYNSANWPYFTMRVNDKNIKLDAEELSYWLRFF